MTIVTASAVNWILAISWIVQKLLKGTLILGRVALGSYVPMQALTPSNAWPVSSFANERRFRKLTKFLSLGLIVHGLC
jgi:hypothetical protein